MDTSLRWYDSTKEAEMLFSSVLETKKIKCNRHAVNGLSHLQKAIKERGKNFPAAFFAIP
jgi:hypothetical protein